MAAAGRKRARLAVAWAGLAILLALAAGPPALQPALAEAPAPSAPASTAGPPGPGPTVFSLEAHAASFDARTLPALPSRAERDRVSERRDPASGTSPDGRLAAVGSGVAAAAPAPALTSSFEGLRFGEDCGGAQCGDGHPPDTNGDVGPTYYIQAVNTAIGIYHKSTGTRVAAFTFNTLMSQGAQGNLCDTDNFGDPVVVYDTFTDRWIISDFAFQVDASGNIIDPPGAYQCFAVSRSGDPVTGGWYFYSLHVSDAFQDYPKLGIWPDGLYMSANMFGFRAGAMFQNVRVWAFNKAQMESGQSVQAVQFDAPRSIQGIGVFTLLPSNARLQTGTPPGGSPNYFASVWWLTDRVRVWKLHADWGSPASSTFTGPFDSPAASTWGFPPNSVPEKDGNELDTLGHRLMMQNQYSNIGGVESLWASHTVAGGSSSQASVRWYQVPVTGGTVGAALQGSTYNPDSRNRWLPSMAVDRVGDMAIGYSVSDASMYPAIRYAGRLAGDPAGTITQTEASLIEGTGAQVGDCGGSACERWGDYSAMTLDPDGCTFWYTNEYYTANGLDDHTRIGSFAFPSCVAAPVPTPTPSPVPTSSPTASPAPDTLAPGVTVPVLSPPSAIPGASVNITASASDPGGVASAEVRVGSGPWAPMAATDGAFGETSEDVTAVISAPSPGGDYQVCVRATDTAANTSGGSACATLLVMDFSLSAPTASRSVAQGASAGYTIDIGRTNLAGPVSLAVGGAPAGTTVTIDPNPAGGDQATLTITTSNCGTATPRGTHLLTVTGTSGSLVRLTVVSLSVSNGAPQVTAPSSRLTSSKMGRSSTRVRTTWSACDADGIASYELQRKTDDGSWKTVRLSSATARSIVQSLAHRHLYRYRVRAFDTLGLRSGRKYGPSFKPLVVDQKNRRVHYSGTWRTSYTSVAYGGSLRYAKAAGASASYTFTGSAIAWTSYLGPRRGAARVYLDGVYQATVDLHRSSNRARRIVYAHSWATSGRHTITVVVVGTAGHPRVDVDAFIRLYPT